MISIEKSHPTFSKLSQKSVFSDKIHAGSRARHLHLLDVKVVKVNRGFETDVFRKKTFNGRSTKYNSGEPNRYKIDLIQYLITRAYKICSSLSRFSSELDFLMRVFVQNRFPCALVNSMIFKFYDVLRSPNNLVLTAEKKPFFVPFLSSALELIHILIFFCVK